MPVSVFVAKRAIRASRLPGPELGQEDGGQHADRDADAGEPRPTITTVPTMALPKPPPISKPAGGSAVNSDSQVEPGPAAHDQHVQHGDQRDAGHDGRAPRSRS